MASRAGEEFVAAGFEAYPGEDEADAAEGEARGDCSRWVDAELGWAVDQCEKAEDERDCSGESEETVAGGFDLQQYEDGCGDEQKDGGVADGQQVEGEERQHDAEDAESAGGRWFRGR